MSKEYKPPQGPPPGYSAAQDYSQHNAPHVTFAASENASAPSHWQSNNPFRSAHTSQQGPSPSKATADEYQPPPGPPPSQQSSQAVDPPPYHDWMQVPDNSLLPPPPAMSYDYSPTANATEDSAESARVWSANNPLYAPRQLSSADIQAVHNMQVSLAGPPQFTGKILQKHAGTTHVQSRPHADDSILLSSLPLYAAFHDDPRRTGRPKTIYFEIRVLKMGGYSSTTEADAGIAIGFAAPPYPLWRLPGWQRASLGVHGDDGRCYVDDSGGGKDFTTAFERGDIVGIGMNFSPSQFQGQRMSVEIIFTRNGKKTGGWDLFEERDAEIGGSVDGLDGTRDLLAAVGFFGQVEFEARFRRDEWLYRPAM